MPASRRLALKRIYAVASAADGLRVLVERLWPRGLRKEEAKVDLWPEEMAPGHALRRWFHEAPQSRWTAFQERYREELRTTATPPAGLRRLVQREPVTLLFAAKDEACNSAVVLKSILEGDSA